MNGRKDDPEIGKFFEALGTVIDQRAEVHERRHGQTLYKPLALSTKGLINETISFLKDKHCTEDLSTVGVKVPSERWVQLQFQPKDPTSRAGLQYTGRFQVRWRIQRGLLRKWHIDSHYVNALWRYIDQFCIENRQNTLLVSVDDKAKGSIGEPEEPVLISKKTAKKSLAHADLELGCLDHDFCVCSFTPSALLRIDIPEDINSGSFYRGDLFVVTKDTITQASNTWSHLVELENAMMDEEVGKPIVVVQSDGGPDRNIKFATVKICWLGFFIRNDIDYLVVTRTCPGHSFRNRVERCMSVLNMGLQNVALARNRLENEVFERQMHSAHSMAGIRDLCASVDGFEEQYLEAVSPALKFVDESFSKLEWTGTPVQCLAPAKSEEVSSLMNEIRELMSIDDPTKVSSKALLANKFLQSIMKEHVFESDYMLVIKKKTTTAARWGGWHTSL
ncbi:hypothetical protein BSKO_07373 [Bryopsis sp. KO-2023]|nr:hypothetical protein BSKO_07373 [Bryopsis sp. KO-2023]